MENIKNNFFFKSKLSLLQKICIGGMFLALIVILQKVVAINYIPIIPFVRISFGGVGLIIFSSILLGPIFGLCIGALSDVLGWLIFDPKTLGFFPSITAIYALLGLSAYFVFCLIRYVKNKKAIICIEYCIFAVFLLSVSLVLGINQTINLYGKIYTIELWQKIVIPIVLFILFAGLILFNTFVGKHFEKKYTSLSFSVYHISFMTLILEVLVMILFGSLMKAFAFGFQTYGAILLCQVIVAFVNIPISTIIISYALLLTRKYYN